jgi:hypothetical protein
MSHQQRPIVRDIDLVFDGINLRAFTKLDASGNEVKYIGGTASSTAKDLYESIIGPECQVKMLNKLRGLASQMSQQNSGLTAWLNHSYKIPEDTLGAFTNASLATRSDNGEDFIDLDIECRVTESNPRALAAWQQIQDGIRHGWSIGAYFLDAHFASDDPDSPDYWTLLIDDIDLLEISLVGIPANQRAWCRSGEDLKAKAVATAEEIVREAKTNPKAVAQRFGVRETRVERATAESRLMRSLALRTLVQEAPPVVDEQLESEPVADAASTAPIVPQSLEAGCGLVIPAELAAETTLKICDGDACTRTDCELHPMAAGTLASGLPDNDVVEALRAANVSDELIEAVNVLARAAQMQHVIAKRDGTDVTSASKISEAISFCAKGVGHGLCIRSAKHIGQAIDCLGAAIGNVVDQPGPTGDADPDELSAQVEKLEPKAGDIIVIKTTTDQLRGLSESFDASVKELAERQIGVIFLSEDIVLSIDNELATKAIELVSITDRHATLSAEVTAAEARLAETDDLIVKAEEEWRRAVARHEELTAALAALDERKAELAEIEARIAAAKNERLGRKNPTVNEMLTSNSESEVRPEHYQRTAGEQLAAIGRMVTGDGKATARDLAT